MTRILTATLFACTIPLVVACGKVDLPASPTATSCDVTINPVASVAPSSGGSFYTAVTSPCAWAASTDVDWITVTYGEGVGVGSVTYTVSANASPITREGRVRVGEEVLQVTQLGPECRFSVQPASYTVPAGGGAFEFTIATDPQCPWSASASDPWVQLGPLNRNGPQAVSFTAAENTSTSDRRATIQVAGHTLSIHQTAPSVAPAPPPATTPAPPPPTTPAPPPPAAPAPPPPTAPAPPPPIAPDPPPPTAPPPVCTFALNSTSQNVEVDGGSFQATVTAAAGCAWTATTAANWISLSGSGGSGNGSLSYSVAANSGSTRTGLVQLAGQALTVTQAGCSYAVAPASQSVSSKGGDFAFSVTTGTSCKWAASSDVSWIGIQSGAGAGTGKVAYSVRPNDGPARSGHIKIGDHSVTVSQGAAEVSCAVSLSPTDQKVPVEGGVFTIKVDINTGCRWSAEKPPSWIVFKVGSGTGAGEVIYVGEKNAGAARSASIVVNGKAVGVSQAGLR